MAQGGADANVRIMITDRVICEVETRGKCQKINRQVKIPSR